MRIITNQTDTVAQFVSSLIPHCYGRGFGNCEAIGVIDDAGWLVAGIVYHNWDREAAIIEMSGAAINPHWLTRRVLRVMFEYPFLPPQIGAGCQMAVMRVPADNEDLLFILARYGFTFIKMPRLFGRGRDGVICCLTVEDWAANKFNRRWRLALAPALEEAA